MEGTGWRFVVGTGKAIVAIVSVPAWFLAAFLLSWFWAGAAHGQVCDRVHQPWCTPGYGMPQYVTVAVLTVASSALLLAALFGWRRRHSWFAACLCAVAAWLVSTLASQLDFLPDWWLTT